MKISLPSSPEVMSALEAAKGEVANVLGTELGDAAGKNLADAIMRLVEHALEEWAHTKVPKVFQPIADSILHSAEEAAEQVVDDALDAAAKKKKR